MRRLGIRGALLKIDGVTVLLVEILRLYDRGQ
jgi:hypothetical protein